jgi:predicted transcriptional regulator
MNSDKPIDIQTAIERATLDELENTRFMNAIREGERAIQEGRTRPAEEVYAEMKAKYGF